MAKCYVRKCILFVQVCDVMLRLISSLACNVPRCDNTDITLVVFTITRDYASVDHLTFQNRSILLSSYVYSHKSSGTQ
jgi:hypothetical protein